MSNMRWCSDGFEIKCDSGETVTATFAKDCCDREIMAWRAWEGKGLPGEPVRDMLVEAVERRFGTVEAMPQVSVEAVKTGGTHRWLCGTLTGYPSPRWRPNALHTRT